MALNVVVRVAQKWPYGTEGVNVVNEVLSNPNRLVELILDCSVTVNRQTLKLDEDVIREVEQLSRNMCYSLHQKRCEILGLILRK